MKRLVALAGLLLVFTGCDRYRDTTESELVSKKGSLREYHYRLSDERTVVCLTYVQGYAGGLSCDWNDAHMRESPLP